KDCLPCHPRTVCRTNDAVNLIATITKEGVFCYRLNIVTPSRWNLRVLSCANMTEYVAFLRGINVGGHGAVTMEDLKKAFESCGFKDVKTVATSGNVVFSATIAEAAIVKKVEAALKKQLGHETRVHVRSRDELQKMVQSDPYKGLSVPKDAKRIITFLDTS